jgi:imidazole glycerol-phosphate synthase subunit HisH
MQSIAVIDYGMGNLRSVAKAIEHVAPQARVSITADLAEIRRADRVVFPGQGAMPDCMREMTASGLRDVLLESAATKPFLGICVGMQMLFEHSEEGSTPGLGLFAGDVRRFPDRQSGPDGAALKVPHMGWNQVVQARPHALWQGIDSGSRFYFVHSFYPAPAEAQVSTGQSDYGLHFTCAIARNNIFGVQFHPEKSAQAGLKLFANFVSWKP